MVKSKPRAPEYARDPVAFIRDHIQVNEVGGSFILLPHQRQVLSLAFAFDKHGRLPFDTIVYSAPKKSGKTALNAALTLWWAFTQEAPNEILIVANDLEQAAGRVYKTAVGMIERNPTLRASAEYSNKGIRLSNGSTIIPMASDYSGAAGSNHGLVSFDELWGFTLESARRLWDELTPVPTRRNSIRLVTTYAGWEGESELLFELFKLGVAPEEHPEGQGVRVHRDLPVFVNKRAKLFTYWDHQPRMSWQTSAYYVSQRASLRPATYTRLHENRWTTSESTFITPEMWDSCVEAERRPLLPDPEKRIWVGVDASTKHDSSAAVAVTWNGDRLALACHRIWRPSPEHPMDLEATIEQYLRDLHARYKVQLIRCDPYQLHRSLTTLAAAGLPIEEYPQTVGNTTQMGQSLFDLLTGRNLALYPSDELRAQALATVGIESARGTRIAKEKASKKIDAIVALAMACVAAIEGRPQHRPLQIYACVP